RDRFNVPVPDEKLEEVPYLKFEEGSRELTYMRERRAALGGYLPARRRKAAPLEVPPLSAFDALLKASGEGREMSTTMAFVRILTTLVRDKKIGKYVVPIVPDESRTFGMEGMFRQLGIYSHVGQLYTPQDAEQLMFYKEDKKGQILEEGINEAGAMSSWIAAATSYSTHGIPMIPFYIYYSMFGFQRIGDLAWAAGDMRARGFLLGGTAGRTTLNGEGLQHEDGHSHLQAATIPNCVSYDPTYAYELAVIMQDGMRRMYQEQEDVYYYITVMNENYEHPAMPAGAEAGILKGMYLLREGKGKKGAPKVQLLGSGTILREVIAGADLLEKEYGVSADIWSVTSFNELRRDGLDVQRWNMLHPEKPPRLSHIEECLKDRNGPIVAATDYMKLYADQVRGFVPGRKFFALGTD
ncbi:MAG: pyruvate dehydrogenase (acetyl-transferring), homodimeric type, partial [Betaproteobacteria bacterium]|nr:pyruvate dehydrogenase (acetyl-transferring), homodimeric type [Betaproteobacteria bacterium]